MENRRESRELIISGTSARAGLRSVMAEAVVFKVCLKKMKKGGKKQWLEFLSAVCSSLTAPICLCV